MNEHATVDDDDLLDLLPVGALSLATRPDAGPVVLRANTEARRLLGPRLAAGRPLADALTPEAARALSEALSTLSAGGATTPARAVFAAEDGPVIAELRRGRDETHVVAALHPTEAEAPPRACDAPLYADAAAATEVGVFEYCFRTDRLDWDATMFALYGLPRRDAPMRQADWEARLAPGEKERLEAARTLPTDDGLCEEEYDILRPDGERRRILARIRIVNRTPEGAPLRAVGSNIDVTVSRRIEAAARRYAEAAEALPDAFALYDAEDRLVAINDAARRLAPSFFAAARIGDRFEDILRRSVEASAWETPDGTDAWIAERLATHRAGDGRRLEIVSSVGAVLRVVERRLGDGSTVTVGIDVTDERRAERRAAEAERRFREATDSLIDGFVIYDADDRLVYANSRYKEIYAESAPAMVEGASFEEVIRYGVAHGQYPEALGREETWIAERLETHRKLNSGVEQALPGGRWLRIVERRTESGETVGLRVDITDLKRQQAALRAAKNAADEAFARLAETSAALEGFFSVSLDLLVIGSPEGVILKANPAWSELLGLPLAEIEGRHFSAFCHPDDLGASLAGLERAREGTTPESFKSRWRGAAGDWRLLEWRGAVAADGTIHAAARDVTEREAESRRLALTTEMSGAGAWEYDPETDRLWWDPITKRIAAVPDEFDPTLEEAIGFYAEEDRQTIAAAVEACVERGEPFDLELFFVAADGTRKFCRAIGRAVTNGPGQRRIAGVFQDVTKRHRRELQNERLRARIQAIVAGAHAHIFLKRRDGRFVDANPAFLKSRGLDSVADMVDTDMLGPEEAARFAEVDARLFETGERVELEETVRLGGETRVFASSKFLIPDAETGEPLLCCVSTDVTEQKRREQEAARARDRFERIFENSPNLMALKRRDGVLVKGNRRFAERYGLDCVAGLRTADLAPPEMARAFDAAGDEVFRTGRPRTDVWEHAEDGSQRAFITSRFLIPDPETGDDLLCIVSFDITEQKRREREAERARDRFERMFEQSQIIAFVKDREGRYLMANRRYREFLGADDVIGKRSEDFLAPEVAAARNAENDRIFATGEQFDRVTDLTHNGVRRRFVMSKFLIPAADSDEMHLCGVAIDITEQMRGEEEAARARDRFQRIFDNTASPMFVKNRAGRIVMANRTYRRLFGIERLDGLTDVDLHDPGHAALYARNDARVFETGEAFNGEETAIIDGELRYFLISKFLIPDPEDEGDAAICGVSTEITDQRRRETEIAQIRARFEAVFEGSDALMFLKRRDGVFIAANRRFVEEAGGGPIVGLNDSDFHLPEGGTDVKANDDLVFETGKPFVGEETVIRPGGRKRVYLSSKFLLHDPLLGEHVLCAICADVTEIKRLQTEAEESRRAAEEANRAKSQFLATMSHEIRTPMNGVIGMADLLGRTPLEDRQREMLDVIRDSGGLLLNVINDILDYSKIEAGRVELERAPFRPCDVLRRVVALQSGRAEEKRVALSIDCGEGAEAARFGDGHRVEQIAHNLLSNAIKFAEGGTVRVSVRGSAPGPLVIEVADDGIGMDEEQAARVFERFAQADSSTTRRYGGTGLGLSIVKGLVERMEGTISVETAPGEGARFTVSLPLPAAASPAAGAVVEAHAPAALPGVEVLAVDDNEINRVVLAALLESAGARCRACADAEEAVAAARERGWDALLLDLSMPGKDGFDTLAEIRALERAAGRAPAFAIAVSAAAEPEDVAGCLARGFEGHVAKPVRRERLVAALAEAPAIRSRLANPGESD